MPRIAYLTCELKARDFDSRLLVAAQLLLRGVSVVVGQQWSMVSNAPRAPLGVFLFKTTNKFQVDLALEAKAAGHRIVLMDEESLAVTDPYVIRQFTDPRAVEVADVFMYQTEAHRAVLGGSGPVVGSPRVDLLRDHRAIYQAEADAHKAAGPYILINTSFGLHNSAFAKPETIALVSQAGGAFADNTAEGREYVRSWVATERRNLSAVKNLVTQLLGKQTRHRIVIRPHPTENPETWREFAGAEVVSGSTPAAWIMGSDVTVHCNSTTGLEAALLGRPTLNVNPDPDSAFSRTLATNNSTLQARTPKDAYRLLRKILDENVTEDTAAWMPRLPENASATIADEIARLAPESAQLTGWQQYARVEHHAKKFTVPVDEALSRIQVFLTALGCTGVTVTVLDDSLFMLSR